MIAQYTSEQQGDGVVDMGRPVGVTPHEVNRFRLTADPGSSNIDVAGRKEFPATVAEAATGSEEADNILRALRRTQWRIYGQNGAAHLLSMKPTTLASRIKKMGLEKHR